MIQQRACKIWYDLSRNKTDTPIHIGEPAIRFTSCENTLKMLKSNLRGITWYSIVLYCNIRCHVSGSRTDTPIYIYNDRRGFTCWGITLKLMTSIFIFILTTYVVHYPCTVHPMDQRYAFVCRLQQKNLYTSERRDFL